jgi:hypothetical protein
MPSAEVLIHELLKIAEVERVRPGLNSSCPISFRRRTGGSQHPSWTDEWFPELAFGRARNYAEGVAGTQTWTGQAVIQ